jgi:hypothetical protein
MNEPSDDWAPVLDAIAPARIKARDVLRHATTGLPMIFG